MRLAVAMVALQPRVSLTCVVWRVCRRFTRLRHLQHARLLRVQLAAMRDFVTVCRRREQLLALLKPHDYFIEDAELWSVNDLVQVSLQHQQWSPPPTCADLLLCLPVSLP